jgi:hypothetical protein
MERKKKGDRGLSTKELLLSVGADLLARHSFDDAHDREGRQRQYRGHIISFRK